MKRIILFSFILLSLSLPNVYGQQRAESINNLKIDKVKALFKGDLLTYFSVPKSEWDSPLKKKKYQESEKYKILEEKAKNEIKTLCNKIYVATGDFNSNYDLDKGTFTIPMPYSFNSSFAIENISESNFNKHYGEYDFVTPKIDEDTAYKIETHKCTVAILFQLTGKMGGYYDSDLMCKPVKIVIRDSASNQNLYVTEAIYKPKAVETPAQKTQQTSSEVITAETKTAEEGKNEESPLNMKDLEEKPSFPGGDTEMFKWLGMNIIYPAEAAEEGVTGKVVVSFIVEKDGSLSNVKVVRGVHPALDKEAIRVTKRMPRWTPGKLNGAPVRVIYHLPFTFKFS